MPKEKKLSKPMLECIAKLKEHGILVRWSGGYWTREGCPKRIVDEVEVPEWYFNWGTIKSLIARGMIMVSEENLNQYTQVHYPVAVILK